MVSSVGILDRMLHPNGRRPAMTFKAFIRANARGPIEDETLERYDEDRRELAGRLGPRRLTEETVQELEAWLKSKYPNANTQQRKITAANWLFRWKGTDFRIRRPPKEYNTHPRTIAPEDYRAVLARITEPMERLAVRLSRDTLWSPTDVAAIRKADVDFGNPTIVRKVRQKTGAHAEAVVEMETADELRAYLESNPELEYIFPGDRRQGKPHRNRTWVNAVLKRHGATFTPRMFRSSGATLWPGDDIKGLMTQGGWTDPKTIFRYYRGNIREVQVRSFEAAMGRPAK